MPEIRGNFRSFTAAEDFFRQKIDLPTQRWDDLWRGQHARAFVVAGATKDSLLTDLRGAVDAAISQGETLEDFRKRFDEIVARNGWTGWKGEGSARGRAWRTQLIYHQNLRSAYMAGRWEELRKFPYLQYQHNTVNNPREEHQAWDGMIVPTDSDWWRSHYPPNGWGCRCSAIGYSETRMLAEGLSPTEPPPGNDGVPPEFQYHVGEAHIGRLISDDEMRAWRDRRADAWEPLLSSTAVDYGRPERVPLDPLPVALPDAPPPADRAALRAAVARVLGADDRVFALPVRSDFTHHVTVSAATLSEHIDPARARVLPLLPHVLENPFEVWLSFERHRGTGRVSLRTRYVRAFDMQQGELKGMVFIAQAMKGQLLGWTVIPVRRGYLERQRYGQLLYERDGLYDG